MYSFHPQLWELGSSSHLYFPQRGRMACCVQELFTKGENLAWFLSHVVHLEGNMGHWTLLALLLILYYTLLES